MRMSTTTDLIVKTDELATTRLRRSIDPPLVDGTVRVRVDRFALTANNITYAAFGEAMNYWRFFPTGEAGWGVIPVWGFGEVAGSRHPELKVGERFYGYWPMADHALLQPARVGADGFSDGAAHRSELHPVYNRYLLCATDPFHAPDGEDVEALLRPLFTTSWLIDDFLSDNDFFGADTVLLSSASSKTAYGTAFQLAQRPGLDVVGLTSAVNKPFCESLGCYGRVIGYDELDQIDADRRCVYVDFAGNATLRLNVHSRFTNLRYSCSVGGTHVDQLGGAKNLPGPRATLFFAPAQSKKRSEDWGADGLVKRLLAGWQVFTAKVSNPAAPWLVTEHHFGPEAVQPAYAEVLAGRSNPRVGHLMSLAAA